MGKTNYSVARVETYTRVSILKAERHNERKNESYSNMNVDLTQTQKNVHYKKCKSTYNERLKEMIDDGEISLRGLKDNAKVLDAAIKDLETISGQKAVITKAKKSVANFKLREGMPIGCKVTLRGERMYEFADRLINLALPRVRDFRGVNPNAFDGRGNYALGIKEQLIFPEIEYDKVDKVRGMDIIFVTTANTDEEARELLTLFGMPYKK